MKQTTGYVYSLYRRMKYYKSFIEDNKIEIKRLIINQCIKNNSIPMILNIPQDYELLTSIASIRKYHIDEISSITFLYNYDELVISMIEYSIIGRFIVFYKLYKDYNIIRFKEIHKQRIFHNLLGKI